MLEHAARSSFISVNSGFLVFEAACQGLGIMSIGEEFEYIKSSNLVRVLPDEPGQNFDIFYVTRVESIQTTVQKRFLEILME